MDINEILSKLLENKSHQNNGRTIQQTLLLLCLEKQIIQNDITLHEQNLTQETGDLLEYKKVWLNCWLKKRSIIFKDYFPVNIMELNINITELYKSIKQNFQQMIQCGKYLFFKITSGLKNMLFRDLRFPIKT